LEKKVKKLFLFVLKLAVSGTALFLVIKKAGLQSLGLYLKRIRADYFFFASLLYVVSIYVSSLRWKVLLWKRRSVYTRYLFVLYLTGSFFSTILPGLIGGDALRIYYLYRKDIALSEAAGSVFLDRYTGYIGLLLTALIAMFFADLKKEIVLILLALILAFVIISWWLLRYRLGSRLLRLENFYDYFSEFFTKPRVVIYSVLLSVVVQCLVVFSVYVIMHALTVSLSIGSLFVYMTLIITASTLPVSISGLGIREWAFVVLFGISSIKLEAATAVSIFWYLSYVVAALPGAIGYLFLKARG